MNTFKIVDETSISLDIEKTEKTQFCFIVFSSKEKHNEIVIDCIERIIEEKEHYTVKRLDESLKSEDSQYKELTDLLKTCSFAIVILDGLRPNVLFEYGILKGLRKPCIVLIEENATVDVINYFKKDKSNGIYNPRIDMDKDVSDIKDRYYISYNKNQPKEIRNIIQKEYSKRKQDIEKEFIHMLIPDKEIVEGEIQGQMKQISNIANKEKDELNYNDEIEFRTAITKIDEIIEKYKIIPPKYYYFTIAGIFSNFNKFEESLNLLEKIFEKNDEDSNTISLKSFNLLEMKEFDKAIETINSGLKIYPKSEPLWHNKGTILERMDQQDEALLCYKKGIQYNKKCPSLHLSLGILLYEKESYDEALFNFEHALKIESTNDEYLCWKARVLEKLNKKDEAKNIVEEALCFNDKNPDAWFILGRLTPDVDESINYFDKTLSLNPKHGGAICSKAASLSNIEKIDEALILLSDISKICPDYDSCITIHLTLSITLAKKEQYDEAFNHAELILKIDDTNIDALELKAKLLIDTGKNDEGIEIFTKLIRENPDNDMLLYNQSCGYALSNKIEESIISLSKAIELNPTIKNKINGDPDFDKIRDNKLFKEKFD